MEDLPGSVILERKRIILRPLYVRDADEVFRNWANDPEVAKYVRWSTHENVDVTREWLATCETGIGKQNSYDWGIVIRDTDALIGSIGASWNEEEDRVEVGYCIGRSYWGKGYTSEALLCMMDYLVTKAGIKHFVSMHAVENPASGTVMRKAGFVYVGDGVAQSFDGKRTFPTKIYHWDAP